MEPEVKAEQVATGNSENIQSNTQAQKAPETKPAQVISLEKDLRFFRYPISNPVSALFVSVRDSF
jgi:hypothetical protein